MNQVAAEELMGLLRRMEAGAFVEGPEDVPALALLRELGLVEPGRTGARLLGAVDWLDAATVEAAANQGASAFKVSVVPVTGSTNDDVMRMVREDADSGVVLAAEIQTAGRGRLGRSWLSTPGGALTFSLLWRFPFGMQRLSALTLAVGVALGRGLDNLGARGMQLKWPNDLMSGGRKLCGVLVETTGSDAASAAVIGIGVNVLLPPFMAERIDQPATDIRQAGVTGTRNEILAQLLLRLGEVLPLFERQGFAPLRAEWDARHAFQDRTATVVRSDGTSMTGRLCGVADDGALLLDSGHGAQRIYSGDIKVHPLTESRG
jgi:BirA family biotin operon repressor/biotin-[acetyl-CoA-carboxylase] ligase